MADDGYLIGFEDSSGNFVEVGRFNNLSGNTSDPVFIEHTGSGTRMELDGSGFDMGGGDITNAGSVSTDDLSTSIGSRVTGSNSDQTITAGGGIQTIEFDTIIFDRGSDYDAPNYQFVAPYSGLYHISSLLSWANTADGDTATHRIKVNGIDEYRFSHTFSSTGPESTQVATTVNVSAGDTLSIAAGVSADADVNIDFDDQIANATYSLIG